MKQYHAALFIYRLVTHNLILTKLLGGLALLAGLAVSLIAVPLIVTMLVAMFTIHIH